MLFESRAEAHDAYDPANREDVRYATQKDIAAWI